MKQVLIIQGPNTHGEEIKQCYNKIPTIFSTLKDSDISNLSDSNFNIVKNEKPIIAGKSNFNYQVINTANGIKKAKELGYEYIFKIRSDITIK